MWRLIYAIPTWLLFAVFRFVMIILGWIVVPIAAAFGAYKEVDGKDGVGTPRKQYHFTWLIMFPWDNKEDGIANDTYVNFDSMFMKIVYWSCFRNPANNLRYVPGLSVKIQKDKVGFVGSPKFDDLTLYDKDDQTFSYFCWQGIYSNYRNHFKIGDNIYRFWIGWKIYPEDSQYAVTGHRVTGAGFGQQLKKVWPK